MNSSETRQAVISAVLAAADLCISYSPTGTVEPRDIYYILEARWRGYRGRPTAQRSLKLVTISRILTTHGYTIVEVRGKGYSKYARTPCRSESGDKFL